MPVPQFAAGVVRKVFVNTRDARVPHIATFFVPEQEPAFPQVLVVRIDAAADMTVAVRPGARLNINVLPNQAQRRAALVGFDQCSFGFVVENGLACQFT